MGKHGGRGGVKLDTFMVESNIFCVKVVHPFMSIISSSDILRCQPWIFLRNSAVCLRLLTFTYSYVWIGIGDGLLCSSCTITVQQMLSCHFSSATGALISCASFQCVESEHLELFISVQLVFLD